MERTGTGDPKRTVELLWSGAPQRKRGPAPRLDAKTVTATAIALADREGLDKVTMRALATELGLASAMALYTYVPGKGELIDLMVDACFAEFDLPAPKGKVGATVRAIADANRVLYRRHPWLTEIAFDRPPLGPGQLRKYELELQALEPLGLTDDELDLTLTLITSHVRAHALPPAGDDDAWWSEAGPALAQHVAAEDYPLASRVGSAAGAYDPDRAYAFGVESIARALRKR